MADEAPDPSRESGERAAMSAAWNLISDVMAGGASVRAKGTTYLPKYEDEDQQEYDRRRNTAPWRPEFEDALRSLASKPFDQDVAPKGDVSDRVKDLVEDIDGRGNSQTRFAAEAFSKGIAKGLHCILVDYPTMEPIATVAQEREANARPYWIQVEAQNIVALYTDWVGGHEIVSHFRYRENITTRSGFEETAVERIRVYEPGKWEVWERQKDAKDYVLVESGEIARGPKGESSVPLVLFFTGEREGEMKVKPPLRELAEMQIELYRALSRKDEVMNFAGAPMLKGKGVPADTKIVVGPKRVLLTGDPDDGGMDRDFDYIQPNAANIAEVRNDVRSIIDDMRRLGMQPLTPQSGTPTATGQSIEAAKAHSACENWANALKDALEQAWVYTCEWMGEKPSVEVFVNTDFDVMPFAQAPLQALATARAAKDISQRTYWEGLRRFDVLTQDFDADEEEQKLAEEQRGLEPEPGDDTDPRTGLPISGAANDDADLASLFSPAVLAGQSPANVRDWFTPEALAAAGM